MSDSTEELFKNAEILKQNAIDIIDKSIFRLEGNLSAQASVDLVDAIIGSALLTLTGVNQQAMEEHQKRELSQHEASGD